MLFKMYEYEVPVQDGEVEGHALISSCKNTKIATSCLITNDRWMLEPTKKKDTPCPRQRRSHSEMGGVTQSQ